MRDWLFALTVGFAAAGSGGGPALAEPPQTPEQTARHATAIAVLDERRLFSESLFGQRVLRETQAAVDSLVAENAEIEAELEREERALAEQRDGMDPQEFRELADAFDRRVNDQRRERAAREQSISVRVQEEERRFQAVASDLLVRLSDEAQFQVIVSAQGLIFFAPQVDITELLIARINAEIGDGTN